MLKNYDEEEGVYPGGSENGVQPEPGGVGAAADHQLQPEQVQTRPDPGPDSGTERVPPNPGVDKLRVHPGIRGRGGTRPRTGGSGEDVPNPVLQTVESSYASSRFSWYCYFVLRELH